MCTYHTLRTVGALGLLVGLQALQAQPLTGTYTINGTSAFASNQFATIQEAFDSLNQRGASGVVVFSVQSGWDPENEPNTITLAGYACTGCQVRLDFSLPSLVILAKSPAATAGDRFVIRLGGHTQSTLATVNNPGQITNLTLIGHDSLIVRSIATGATTTGVIGLVSTTTAPLAVDGLTIRGFRLEGRGRANTFSGIYVGPDASLTTGAPTGTVRGLQIIRNTVNFVSRPIHVRGVRSNFGTINKPIVIDSNLIGLASSTDSWAAENNIGGIHVAGAQFVRVRHNTVTGAQSDLRYQFSGVRLDSCENFEISRNHIYGLKYTGNGGWGMYGIAVILPSSFFLPNPSNEISNNMIADIVGDATIPYNGAGIVSGIFLHAAGTSAISDAKTSIVHNSIHLFGNNTLSSYGGGGSAAICLGSNIGGGVIVEGNILQNKLRTSTATTKSAAGIWIVNSSFNGPINWNAYRIDVPGISNYFGEVAGTGHFLWSTWQTPSREADGVPLTADVPFISNTNLHISPSVSTQVINAGNPAYNGTRDFDSQVRPLPNSGPGANGDPGTAPDIGADELDGTLFTSPIALAAGSGTFRAYPDPSSGTFTVEVPVAGRYELQVLDAAGKLVHTQAMENALSQEVRLSVPAGVYQLVVVGEGRREVIRLVVNP